MGKIKRRKLKGVRYTPTLSPHDINRPCSEINKVNESSARSTILRGTSLDQVEQPNNAQEFSNYNNVVSAPDYCVDKEDAFRTGVKDSFKDAGAGGLKMAYEKISSNISEEKLTGLNMLAAFALEDNAAELMVQSKIVSTIAPLLGDGNSQIRLAAAGTLRNLCAGGSDEVVEMMVQQDVLFPLAKLLKEYSNNKPPADSSKLGKYLAFNKGVANSMDDSDPCNLIFIHATNLLWNLCECNEEAVLAFNQEGLVQILLKHVNPFVWGYSISMAAADCLLCVSEDNTRSASAILPLAEALVSLVSQALAVDDNTVGIQFAVTISGILLNINYWTPGGIHFRQLFEIFSKALELDVNHPSMSLAFQGHQKESEKNLSQEYFEHAVSAQLLAFEILSNICCPDEEEEWEECEEVNSDEEMNANMEDKMEIGRSQLIGNSLSPEIIEGIKYYKLVDMTLKKIKMSNINPCDIRNNKNTTTEKLSLLLVRALQCLQNLVSCLDIEDLSGPDNMYSTWLDLGKHLLLHPETDQNLLEAASGAMRAIFGKLSSTHCPQLMNVTQIELKQIFEAGLSCSAPSVRANLTRMVGALGCLLVQRNSEEEISFGQSSKILIDITTYLLKIGQEDDALWVSAESLDAIIDIFSDDKTDRLAAQGRLVEHLKGIEPQFKAKHNNLRKKLGDHRPLVITVRDNLLAFIKYKGPRTAKYVRQMNKVA